MLLGYCLNNASLKLLANSFAASTVFSLAPTASTPAHFSIQPKATYFLPPDRSDTIPGESA